MDTHDVIVVGGSYAGLSAALQLGRARRRTLIIDGGKRRNRAARHAHGFLGQDGEDPAVIAAKGRREALAYPTVELLEGEVTHARKDGDGFALELADGETRRARRLVLAIGVRDELPDVPGLRERWGRSVFHCPYCHGYELDRGAIAALASSPASAHVALLLTDWGPVTYFTRGLFEPTAEELEKLTERRVTVVREPVVAVDGDTDLVVRLANGRAPRFAGGFVASRTSPASPIAEELGCALEEGPTGTYLKVDPMRKETTVPNVFACGDAAVMAANVAYAVADGARAGASAHFALLFRLEHVSLALKLRGNRPRAKALPFPTSARRPPIRDDRRGRAIVRAWAGRSAC